jgi:hypothetical protein
MKQSKTKVVKEDPDYINFGDFARKELNQQCQYASRYLTGVDYPRGSPNLGEGLRYTGSQADYHGIMIHKDDAPIFKERYKKYRKELGCE